MNRLHRLVMFCLPFCFLLAVTACNLLAPRRDTSRFYLLTPAADAQASTSPGTNGHEIAVGVGPIDFPGYLKRPEVVTRVDSDRLELSDESRWAEPLDSNFQRVLAQNLARQLSSQRVVLFPWFGNPPLDYRVEVQVHRFDTGADGQSHLSANWLIKDGHSGAVLFMTETTASAAAAPGDANASVALSRALNTLSDQIAGQIEALERKRAQVSGSEERKHSVSDEETGRD
jgi:uncharacterized protein